MDPDGAGGISYLLQRLWNAWSEAPVAGPATTVHPAVIAAAHALAGDGELSTAALAHRLGLGAGHLARIFRAEMGISLVEYRNRRRLDRVKRILP